MAGKSIVNEAHQVEPAIELIELGARLQILDVVTSLSGERLPPRGIDTVADLADTIRGNRALEVKQGD